MTEAVAAALWTVGFLTVLGTAAAIGISVWMRRGAKSVERSMGRRPTESPWELLYSLREHTLPNLALTVQRAERGRVAEIPMGSRPRVDWLDQVGFDGATVFPRARARSEPVDLRTIIGVGAARPLSLALPVMVAPMGWGIGLTREAKVALAQGATLAGTATSSGEGPYLPAERAAATRWILEWSRGPWAHQPEVAALADMIVVQLGQGSEGTIGIIKPEHTLPRSMKQAVHRAEARISAFTVDDDAEEWVQRARDLGRGCPVGVKLPATAHLEEDVSRALAWGVDVVVLDGAGAGSAGSPAVVSEHFGLATAVATVRARRWLSRHHGARPVALVVSGGVHGAADIAKLLALGADAVDVGSTLLFAMTHEQVAPVLPGVPPTALVFPSVSRKGPRLDVDQAAEHVAGWFRATSDELTLLAQALGHNRLQDLGPSCLRARTSGAARALGLARDIDCEPAYTLARGVARLCQEYRGGHEVLRALERLVRDD